MASASKSSNPARKTGVKSSAKAAGSPQGMTITGKAAGGAVKISSHKIALKASVFTGLNKGRFQCLMETGRKRGFLADKDARISGRVNETLVAMAKKTTGITSDTDLIELALMTLALDDDFGATLVKNWGTLDPDLDLGL